MGRSTLLQFLQVVMVYSALKTGWTVEKVGRQKYRFTKPIERVSIEDLNPGRFLDQTTGFQLSEPSKKRSLEITPPIGVIMPPIDFLTR